MENTKQPLPHLVYSRSDKNRGLKEKARGLKKKARGLKEKARGLTKTEV